MGRLIRHILKLFKKGKEEVDTRVLIHVRDKEIQAAVFNVYQVKVPIDMVLDTTTNTYNSHLYFEMWEPSKKFFEWEY